MIVRDEAAVIARCLTSVRPFIDCFVIVDTGSTDETMAIVWKALAGLPGIIAARPWVDFGHNRSEALALARPHAAYSLMIDPADELLIPNLWNRPTLTADSYLVEVQDGSSTERSTQLVSNAFVWRYVGVLFEVVSCPSARSVGQLPIAIRRNHDGRRRRDASTYRDDAAILAKALETETDPYLAARYAFYLAQSYRDCGDREAAILAYLHRATLGLWEQEVFVSLYEAARQMEALDRDVDMTLATYRRATEACPARAEAAHGASRLCRFKGRHAEGYAIAKPAIALAAPSRALSVEAWIYRYGMLDEFAVHAYWSGHYEDCGAACRRMLASNDLPEGERARVAANLQFGEDRIAEASTVHSSSARLRDSSEAAVQDLRRRLGPAIDAVNLRVNHIDTEKADTRPLVVWIHDDIDRPSVQWVRDRDLAAKVDRFVFVSAWQMARYVQHFGLRTDRCSVLPNAVDTSAFDRKWTRRFPFRVVYAGAPDNGLSVFLDALERLGPLAVEVHVWLSQSHERDVDDQLIQTLETRARGLANVDYHGFLREGGLRDVLRDCDFFAYPCLREETSCVAVMEAMAHGCRVIGPAHGALPETVGIYGRTYLFTASPDEHATQLAAVLLEEVNIPWGGRPALSIEQQQAVRANHDWPVRIAEWHALLDRIETERLERDVNRSLPKANQRTIEALVRLRDRGFVPSGIIDAGARDGSFSRAARQVFSTAHILMIEARADHGDALAAVCREIDNASHVTAVLGARNQRARPLFVREAKAALDGPEAGFSMFKKSSHDASNGPLPRQRSLASVVATSGQSFQMLKIALGGAELDVLKGLAAHLADIEVILMRLSLVASDKGAPLLDAVLAELNAMGFVLCDILDEHRYREGSLLTIDGLFVRPRSRFRLLLPA